MKLLFLVLVSTLVSALATPLSDKVGNHHFFANITCATTYKLGDKILCRFEITNIKETDLYLLKWRTPLGGMRDDFLTISNGDRVIPYDGIFVKRGEPRAETFILIPAGGTVSATLDLSEAYSISTRGNYTVQLETTIEYYSISGSASYHEVLVSHIMTFRMVGNGRARPTLGERARLESLASPQLKTPVCTGGNFYERIVCCFVHWFAHRKLYSSYLATYNKPDLYREWFGDPACCHNIVTSTLELMYDTMNKETITYYMHGDYCNPGDYAYTFKNSRGIYYCDMFWQSKFFYPPHDSKICTCVHELSHAIASTDDIEYGAANCKRLARDHPEQAVRNADNYGYFAEVQ